MEVPICDGPISLAVRPRHTPGFAQEDAGVADHFARSVKNGLVSCTAGAWTAPVAKYLMLGCPLLACVLAGFVMGAFYSSAVPDVSVPLICGIFAPPLPVGNSKIKHPPVLLFALQVTSAGCPQGHVHDFSVASWGQARRLSISNNDVGEGEGSGLGKGSDDAGGAEPANADSGVPQNGKSDGSQAPSSPGSAPITNPPDVDKPAGDTSLSGTPIASSNAPDKKASHRKQRRRRRRGELING